MTNTDELLYKYAEELTDVQHIKLRDAIDRLALEARIDEITRVRPNISAIKPLDDAMDAVIYLDKMMGDCIAELKSQLQELDK